MKYIIIEIQTAADGTVAQLVQQADTREQAESIYHSILSYAAVSALSVHACTILTNDGFQLMTQSYKHAVPEPEAETAEEE